MALANDLKVLTWIANKGLAYLVTNLPYITCGSSQYMPEFDNKEYAKGDTIQIRRSNRRIGGEGAVIALDGVIEKTENLKIEKQFNDGLDFTTKEEALFVSGEYGRNIYSERYIYPSILRLVSKANAYIADRAMEDLNLTYGTPGTALSSTSILTNTRALMETHNMPVEQDTYLITNPTDGAQLKNTLFNYFNNTFNKGIGEKYFLQQICDFQFESSSAAPHHTAGLGADAVTYPNLSVKASISGGNAVVITGFGGVVTGALKKGDIFTVADCNALTPTLYKDSNRLAQFVITADANAVGAGDATAAFRIAGGPIVVDSTNPFRNVTAPMTATKKVIITPSHNVNTAFCTGGLDYAMPKMREMWTPSSVTVTDNKFGSGISLRLSRSADIINDKNIMRWDLLVGAKWHAEYGVRVIT